MASSPFYVDLCTCTAAADRSERVVHVSPTSVVLIVARLWTTRLVFVGGEIIFIFESVELILNSSGKIEHAEGIFFESLGCDLDFEICKLLLD